MRRHVFEPVPAERSSARLRGRGRDDALAVRSLCVRESLLFALVGRPRPSAVTSSALHWPRRVEEESRQGEVVGSSYHTARLSLVTPTRPVDAAHLFPARSDPTNHLSLPSPRALFTPRIARNIVGTASSELRSSKPGRARSAEVADGLLDPCRAVLSLETLPRSSKRRWRC